MYSTLEIPSEMVRGAAPPILEPTASIQEASLPHL